MTPMERMDTVRYSVSTQMNAMMVALPTSFAFLARPEMATAPSMPINTQMVTIMAVCTWSTKASDGSAPVVRFAMKMSGLKAPMKMMAMMPMSRGTNFEMVMTALMRVTSLMPRLTRKA